MAHQYQVLLYDTNGALEAVFDEWNSLYYFKRVSDYSYHNFSIDGKDDRHHLFLTDHLVEVKRRDQEAGIPWYTEYVGFHRTGLHQITDRGRVLYTSYGRGLEDLLHRRTLLWKAGTYTASEGVAADAAIRQFVNYNAGPAATTGNGRIAGGATTGLTIGTGVGGPAAANWYGERSYKNLLDVIKEIGEAKSVDFDVRWTGGQNFVFNTYYPRLGTDRSGAGAAAPTVFSLDHANMSQPYLTESRMEETTAVYVLGQGEGANRTVVERLNSSELTLSPWNRVEFTHDARNESSTNALNAIGDGHLVEHGFDEHISFQVVPSPGSVYGRDYFLGDLVKVEFHTATGTRKIMGAEITVSDGKENIRIHFEED